MIMIMRIWHGVTKTSRSDDFFNYLMKTGVPWYRSLDGNRGVFVLRRAKVETSEFLLLSLWDSMESIRRFTGADIDKAIYRFSEDGDYLLELEPEVAHYEVLTGFSSGESSPQASGKYSIIV
jgi:heme-degrading monooxygenase HmoA